MTYQEGKEAARREAIDWQAELSEAACSYDEIAEMQARFEKTGKRYGLLTEFRENGIL